MHDATDVDINIDTILLKSLDEAVLLANHLMETESQGPYFFTDELYQEAVQILILHGLDLFDNKSYLKHYSISKRLALKHLLAGYQIDENRNIIKKSCEDNVEGLLAARPCD